MGYGMVFNGINKPHIHLLKGRKMSPYASIRHDLLSIKNGARLMGTKVDPLYISQPIGYVVKGDVDALTIKDELTSWLITKQPKTLEFEDMPGRFYNALLDGNMNDFDKFAELRQGTINFVCPDPYGYGAMHDLDLDEEWNSFLINGQVETPWISRTIFTEAMSQYVLDLDNGDKVMLNYEFVVGDVLKIDYKYRYVTLNNEDITNALSILQTKWSNLEPGYIDMKASHPSTISYRERFH